MSEAKPKGKVKIQKQRSAKLKSENVDKMFGVRMGTS